MTSGTLYKCSAGSFSTGGASTSACTSCPAGYYCPTAGMTAGYGNQCTAGSYCVSGSIQPVLCSAGTYNSLAGQTSAAACTACTAGYYCSAGSTTATQNACSTTCSSCSASTGACLGCVVGFYYVNGSLACPGASHCLVWSARHVLQHARLALISQARPPPPVVQVPDMCTLDHVACVSLLRHMFVMPAIDWSVSWLCGWVFLHQRQPRVHRLLSSLQSNIFSQRALRAHTKRPAHQLSHSAPRALPAITARARRCRSRRPRR